MADVERRCWRPTSSGADAADARAAALLKVAPQAAIVSIGSTFGSLPFPGFAAYSAAKSGLRGFSQALRRELSDSQVAVIHLAPRAIDTPHEHRRQ